MYIQGGERIYMRLGFDHVRVDLDLHHTLFDLCELFMHALID